MGLLDKVDNIDDAKPAKAKPKAAKAVAKAKPRAAKAVAKKATPKAAKPASAKAKGAGKDKPEKIRPSGLPEGFELAGNMPRYIGWIINFAWNFGVAIGLLSILSTGADSDLTIGWAVALLMILVNWLVLPIWTGRNIGEFVSRTKYINSSGNKPIFLHAVLNNSIGFLSLIGLILMMANFQNISTSGMIPFITGVVFIVFWIFNFFLKKNSDFSQGVFDLAFSSYLVKHVATGDETGWMARFESLGDFGDKWAERSANREVKQKEKAAKKAAKAVEKKESAEETSDSEEATDSEDDSSED
ncbi:MAG: hypothetical protein MK197_04780 [Candidatus Poseidoniaceae archaeon]|nr:hypothetical protein [Candidatus Poseidoniaceae archaeon]